MTLRELYNKFHATYDLHMASTCDANPVDLMFDVKEKKTEKSWREYRSDRILASLPLFKTRFFLFLIGSMRRIKNILQYLAVLAGA